MKTLKESLLGDIEDQVKEISDTTSIGDWINKYVYKCGAEKPDSLYTIDKNGDVTFKHDVIIPNNPNIKFIPFHIKEAQGLFESNLQSVEDYSNFPDRCKQLSMFMNPKSVFKDKTFEISGGSFSADVIIFGGSPKQIKNITFKYTGNHKPVIEFVSLTEKLIKNIKIEGFKEIQLRTSYTKLKADIFNKYKSNFPDVIEIKPQWPRTGDIKLVRDTLKDDFYELEWRQSVRDWRKF